MERIGSRCSSSCALGAIICLVVAPASLAQRVSGVVRDSVEREPVAGAVVALVDSTGATINRTMTGASGRYTVSPLYPGPHHLRVLRIGFRPRSVRVLLRAAADTTLDVDIGRLPTLLEAVHVDDRSICDRRPDRANALSLWEQARAGLIAAEVGRETNPATVISISYDRTLDRAAHQIEHQSVHHDSMLTSQPFVAARAASELENAGYVENSGTVRTFYAPDVQGLLDPAFAATHCFSLRRDAEQHPAQVGVGFEPTPNRSRLPEIAGTLWIDSVARELRGLEFTYVHVDRAEERANAGGVLSFRSAPNGVTLIDRWNLHIPYVVHPAVRITSGGLQFAGVIAVHDMGAQLVEARWPDGTQWRSPLGRLRGRVVAPDGRPVANALVWLSESDDTSRTAADGSYEIPRVLPGPYDLHVADSVAAPFRFSQNARHRVNADSLAAIVEEIVMPELRQAIADSCRGHFPGPGGALLLGMVTDDAGVPLRRATIEATAVVPSAFFLVWRARTVANDTGYFRVCGVDRAMPLRLTVSPGSGVAPASAMIHIRSEPLASVRLAIRNSVNKPER